MRSRVSERYQAGKHRPHEPRFPKRELGGKSGAGSGLVVLLSRPQIAALNWRSAISLRPLSSAVEWTSSQLPATNKGAATYNRRDRSQQAHYGLPPFQPRRMGDD